MKRRFSIVFTLAVGLVVLVSWAAAAQGAAAAVRWASSSGPLAGAAVDSSGQNTAGLAATTDITFTPAYTVYLPAVLKTHQACSAVPILLSPVNGSSLDTLTPLFRWDNGNDLSTTELRLQVSADATFATYSNYLWSSGDPGIHEFRFASNYDPATIYYWRAWLICGATPGSYSAVWSFTTGSGGTIPPAVTLNAPANGSTVSASTVTLQWLPVSGAVEYAVRWRKVGDSGYTWQWVTGTQNTIGGLSANTTYEWWVSARNNYALGANSATWHFTTPAGLAPDAFHGRSGHYAVAQDDDTIWVLEGQSSK